MSEAQLERLHAGLVSSHRWPTPSSRRWSSRGAGRRRARLELITGSRGRRARARHLRPWSHLFPRLRATRRRREPTHLLFNTPRLIPQESKDRGASSCSTSGCSLPHNAGVSRLEDDPSRGGTPARAGLRALSLRSGRPRPRRRPGPPSSRWTRSWPRGRPPTCSSSGPRARRCWWSARPRTPSGVCSPAPSACSARSTRRSRPRSSAETACTRASCGARDVRGEQDPPD
jgi:hypothetical protein